LERVCRRSRRRRRIFYVKNQRVLGSDAIGYVRRRLYYGLLLQTLLYLWFFCLELLWCWLSPLNPLEFHS
jgi:hypothetical protein